MSVKSSLKCSPTFERGNTSVFCFQIVPLPPSGQQIHSNLIYESEIKSILNSSQS